MGDNNRVAIIGTRSLTLFLTFIVSSSALFALDPGRRLSQYGHTSWRIQDGFFDGQVSQFAQTADGYLWIGTRSGHFRFDGVRFVRWSSPAAGFLRYAGIESLLAARDGTLWVGIHSRLVHLNGQKVISIQEFKGDPYGIVQDKSGDVWVGSSK